MPEKSTTPDLVELLRRFTESLERRDFDEALSFFVAEPVWDMSAMGMGTFEGSAAIRGLLEDWLAPYAQWEIEVEDWLDLGNGVVLAVLVESGRPTGSTGRVQLRYASVGVWAHGMISRAATYADLDEARAAAERLAESRG
jgi:ketosteroid isomerase-like protein